MDFKANRASGFIAVAHFSGGEAKPSSLKTAAISPATTIADVFAAFWPANDDQVGQAMAKSRPGRLPLRIEILPDEKTIPADDPEEQGFFSQKS